MERLKRELATMQANFVELKEGMAVLEDLAAERRLADAAKRLDVRSLTPKDVVLSKFSGSDNVDGYVIQKKHFLPLLQHLQDCKFAPRLSKLDPQHHVAKVIESLPASARSGGRSERSEAAPRPPRRLAI